MDDIFAKPPSTYQLSDFKLSRMVLSPKHWQSCDISGTLKWHAVKFERPNLNRVPLHTSGVYTLVVKPGIVDHPACAYLMYVGKAHKEGFRRRLRSYFKEKDQGVKSRRPHITEMMLKWDGYLWLYYAEIEDLSAIKTVEDELLSAYLPPSNRTFPSKVRYSVHKLFAQ